jgi:hypothetical protein
MVNKYGALAEWQTARVNRSAESDLCSSVTIFTNTTWTRDYWVFGLCPSSGILKNTKEHNVSETESLSVLRWGGGRHLLCCYQWLGLVLYNGPNRVGVSHPSPENGNRSGFRKVFFKTPDDGQSPETELALSCTEHRTETVNSLPEGSTPESPNLCPSTIVFSGISVRDMLAGCIPFSRDCRFDFWNQLLFWNCSHFLFFSDSIRALRINGNYEFHSQSAAKILFLFHLNDKIVSLYRKNIVNMKVF